MKILKGLLTAVLILGMSTGFAAPSVGEQTFNHSSIETIPYDDLSPEAQEDIEIAINDYCATGDLKAYKQSNVKLAEALLKYNSRIEKSTMIFVAGSVVGLSAGFERLMPNLGIKPIYLVIVSVASIIIGIRAGSQMTRLMENKGKADSLLKEQLELRCNSQDNNSSLLY